MKKFEEIIKHGLTNKDGKLTMKGMVSGRISLNLDEQTLLILSKENMMQPKWQKFLVDYCGFDELLNDTPKKHYVEFEVMTPEQLKNMEKKLIIADLQLKMLDAMFDENDDDDMKDMRRNFLAMEKLVEMAQSKNKVDYTKKAFQYENEFQDDVLSPELHQDIAKYYEDKTLQSQYETVEKYIENIIE